MPKQVTNGIVQTMELLQNTTGVDLEGLMKHYVGAATANGKVEPEELAQGS